jgi:hypothetical protein
VECGMEGGMVSCQWQLSVVGVGVRRTEYGAARQLVKQKEPPGGTPAACATNPKWQKKRRDNEIVCIHAAA